MEEATAIYLCEFLVDKYEEILAVPEDLRDEITEEIRRQTSEQQKQLEQQEQTEPQKETECRKPTDVRYCYCMA